MAKKFKDPKMKQMGRAPKVIVKKKSGILGKILALMLGFVLGIVAVIGGVVGAGYWAVTRPIKEVDGVVNTFAPNVTLNKYLTEDYYNGTIKDLFGGVGSAVNEISSGEGSFSSLAKISPTVEEAVTKLADKLVQFGCALPKENIVTGVMDTPFKNLGGFLSNDLLNAVQLGDLLIGTKAFTYETLTADDLMMTLLYGELNVDYTLNSETQTIEPIAGGKPFLSVGSIRTGGIMNTLGVVPLDALLKVGEADGMMCTLAYGSSNRYAFVDGTDASGNPTRVVEMQPVVYVRNAENDYTLDGETLSCTETLAEGKTDEYVLTFTGEDGTVTHTQYVKKQADSENRYDVFTEADGNIVRYSKTTISTLMNNAQGLLDNIELASALNINETSNTILITLAYGVEGEDFEYTAEGKIQMLEGKRPKTISDLTGDNLNSLISDLPLDTLINIDLNDGMMTALAYGANSHWTKNGDKVKMLPVQYSFEGNKVLDIDGVEIKDASFALTGDVYTVTIDGVTTYAKANGAGGYYAYADASCVDGEELLYKKTTVYDLQNNTASLLDNIQIKDLMPIEYGTTNSLLIVLAYGVEGEDFDVVNGEIVPRPGHPPKTIGSLMGGDLDGVINTLPLDAILSINVTDNMMTALAYGAKSHWTVDNGKVKMLPVEYTLKDGAFYDKDGDRVTEAGTPVNGVYAIVIDEETKYLKANGSVYYEYDNPDCNGEANTYKKVTVGDLQQHPEDLINNIQLADILNLSSPTDPNGDKLMLALAYGNKGMHYTVNNGTVTWLTDKDGNAYKPRTIGDLRTPNSTLFQDIYIGDALGVNPSSHPVLIAIAYGEAYTVVNGEIIPTNGTPRTLNSLTGANSADIINGITLEAALDLNAKSDKLMRALAYGQEGTHYGVDPADDTKVVMKQAFYTLDTVNGENCFVNKNGDKVAALSSATANVDGYDYKLTLANNQVEYLKKDPSNEEHYLVFDGAKTAISFKKATIKDLSSGTGLLDNITLADALGVNKGDGGLQAALAFDKDGNPYTIGALSKNPDAILNNITVADALSINPATTTDRMLLALAYGQKDVHYSYTTGDEDVTMLQAFYELKTKNGVKAFYDKYGNQIALLSEATATGEDRYTLPNGERLTQSTDENFAQRYYVFDAQNNEIRFEKATIGTLSGQGSGLINSLTLADALNVTYSENPAEGDKLKQALAFSKDGKTAYTIGDFSENPTDIVYSIELDAIMAADKDNPMTMYLLYGKENVHYKWEGTDATMLEKVMVIHGNGADEAYCLHNEYGEEVEDDTALTAVNENVQWTPNGATQSVAATVHFTFTRHGIQHRLIMPVAEEYQPHVKIVRLKGKNTVFNNNGTVYYVQYLDAEENVWLNENYEKNTISELTKADSLLAHLTERLTLSEVLMGEDLSGNNLLAPIANTTISELPDAISQLTLVDSFSTAIEYLTADFKATDTQFTAMDGTTYTISGAAYTDGNGVSVRAGDFVDKAGNKVSGNDRVLKGAWAFLLKDSDLSDGETKYYEYTVQDMDKLTTNMMYNVQNSALRELEESGLIVLPDSLKTKQVETSFSIYVNDAEQKAFLQNNKDAYLVDLSINDILIYFDIVLSIASNLSSLPFNQ